MKFDELDEKMRVRKTAFYHCVLPEMFMVVRSDGRGFKQLTRRRCESKHSFNPTLPDWTACDS
jgi:tRNA(His) guanylyltransferase